MAINSNYLKEASLSLRSDLHLARKAWHILTGVTGLWAYFSLGLSTDFVARCLLAIAILGFVVDFFRMKFSAMNRFVLLFMGPLMRESEKHSLSGLPFYALGVSLTLFFFPAKMAILATLFLIFADPIASIVGILYGKDPLLKNKSLQGTYAAFFTCFLLSFFYGLHYKVGVPLDIFIFSVLAGFIGALSELAPTKLDDNLTLPVLSGFGLVVLNSVMTLY